MALMGVGLISAVAVAVPLLIHGAHVRRASRPLRVDADGVHF